MAEPSLPAETCPLCAGPVPVEETAAWVACPYCGSALYLEAHALYARVVLAPVVPDRFQARTRILDWADRTYGRRGVRAMRAVLRGSPLSEMRYFALWAVSPHGDATHVVPAAVTAASEMWKLRAAGRQAEESEPLRLPAPEIPAQAALAWLTREGIDPPGPVGVRLVYAPVYVVRAAHEGQLFTLVVEASTGRVLADYPPAHLGLSWNAISYLAYGAVVLTGLLASALKQPLAWVAGAVREALFDLLARLPQALLAFRPTRLLFDAVRLISGPLVRSAIWLVVIALLFELFTGRWRPGRWFRTRYPHRSPDR